MLEHGVAGLSLRPLAAAVGSSPRVLLFLFGSKAELVRAILARAREDELALLERVRATGTGDGLIAVASELWGWLAAEEHRGLLALWVEGYARSLIDPERPLGGLRRDHRRGLARRAGREWRARAKPSRRSCSPSCAARCSTCSPPATSSGRRAR